MASNVGCLIPSSQATASPSLSIEVSTMTLALHSVGQICFQGQQILQVAFTRMCPKYSEIYLLVVCTISQRLAIINMAVLRSLVAEVLGPTQKQDIASRRIL